MKPRIDYTLYLCTDRTLMSTNALEEAVRDAIEGGCTLIQLREKDCSGLDFYKTAVSIKKITDEYHIPLIINDRVDIALAVDAAGVHVGQSDLPASVVRKLLGEDKIIGVSAATLEEAKKAQEDGVDYIGVGAMFTTKTKTNTRSVSIENLKQIRANVTIPMVVIGGINKQTVSNVVGLGIDGIAVVSAVIAERNIEEAARNMKELFYK